MGWTMWLVLGVALVSLYVLGLASYRVFLNARDLKNEMARAQDLIEQAQQFQEIEIVPAEPSSTDDLVKLVGLRRAFLRAREQKAIDRQRRLVQRVRDIEMDKR